MTTISRAKRDRGFEAGSSFDLAAFAVPDFGKMVSLPLSPSFSVDSTLRDTRNPGLHMPSDVASTGVNPFRAGGTGSAEAFDKLKSGLLRCEARLRKALDEERSLRPLCDEKELQKKMEALERLRDKVGRASLARDNTLVNTEMIAKLESELSKVRDEIVDARVEDLMHRTRADQEMAIYSMDVADAQAKLRRIFDREERIDEYARCKSRRKTLEEIHARGFALSEELALVRADERDAQLLLPEYEENKDEAGKT
ncbi:uncharacterized protein [Nicotiana sylvestris]|uniref:uncharacterized protein n=1 Tax=Nicotiana sylvestris TaxID=4096 RepID=UPI00388C9D7A